MRLCSHIPKARHCFITLFLSICVQEPGSLTINTTWSRQGVHSKAALLPRARSLPRVNSLLYVRTHVEPAASLHVRGSVSTTTLRYSPCRGCRVAKEVFEIKRRSTQFAAASPYMLLAAFSVCTMTHTHTHAHTHKHTLQQLVNPWNRNSIVLCIVFPIAQLNT